MREEVPREELRVVIVDIQHNSFESLRLSTNRRRLGDGRLTRQLTGECREEGETMRKLTKGAAFEVF